MRKDKLTSLFARAEMDQPPNRLCHYDNTTEYSDSESVCDFRPLKFPDSNNLISTHSFPHHKKTA